MEKEKKVIQKDYVSKDTRVYIRDENEEIKGILEKNTIFTGIKKGKKIINEDKLSVVAEFVMEVKDMEETIKLINDDLFNVDLPKCKLLLTDIPYGEVNRKSNGLRELNKGNADIITFDVFDFFR